jgi:predicted site-specific integrase-resolvase
MSKTFLRKRAVADRYGINKRTVDRWSEDGRLPKPIYRGIIPLWDLCELDAEDFAAAAAVRSAAKPVSTTKPETTSTV